MHRLQDKIAVITGASSGIGLATAKLFASNGARVFMAGRGKRALEEAVLDVGGGARGIQCDISRLTDLDRLFSIVREEAGDDRRAVRQCGRRRGSCTRLHN